MNQNNPQNQKLQTQNHSHSTSINPTFSTLLPDDVKYVFHVHGAALSAFLKRYVNPAL